MYNTKFQVLSTLQMILEKAKPQDTIAVSASLLDDIYTMLMETIVPPKEPISENAIFQYCEGSADVPDADDEGGD